MTRTLAVLLVLSLAACSAVTRDLGVAGQSPGEISCKGKFTLTGMGKASFGSGIIGGGDNAWSISGDCGDGAMLRQGMPTTP